MKFNQFTSIAEIRKVYQRNFIKHDRLIKLFAGVLSEKLLNDEVIHLINNSNMNASPTDFLNSIKDIKHKSMLSEYNLHDLSNMRLFKVPNYNIGYALKPNGSELEVVCLHNNELYVKNIGKVLMNSAVINGGTCLDHYDVVFLNDLYNSMGFKEYKRIGYNPIYDSGGLIKAKYGEIDVIYRKLI